LKVAVYINFPLFHLTQRAKPKSLKIIPPIEIVAEATPLS